MVSHRENNTQRIVALDERAEALGLKPGIGIADARAMHPGIQIVDALPQADRRLLESLADWCDRYTPLVALEGSDGLFLDITGCAHLFGNEKRMMDDILSRLFHQGFDARAGLGPSPGIAWAAARFLSPAIVPPGEEAETLAPLPLAALRIAPAVRAGLESVGLKTAGAIMAAPRAPLTRRFGAALLTRLDQALGRVEEAITPRLPVPPLSVERQLAEPVMLADDIQRLVGMLALSLRAELERRGEGAHVLQLALFRVDGAMRRLAVGASRPLRDPVLIGRLFQERLAAFKDRIDAGYGFELVRLSVLKASPFAIEQTDLAGSSMAVEEDLALFSDRVRARLGETALLRPVLVESHRPERAATFAPAARVPVGSIGRPRSDKPGPGPAGMTERPIRLFSHPEPVDVVAAEVPEGPPLRFRWRRAVHRVARAEGPERIAAEWWRDPQDMPTRDYFRVEDDDGRRYWLFRQGFYGTAETMPRWFMHGVFA
ncbi:DNA polymerase Y family protein [Nitratireductor arenosus]|uniref:DNA polymerase Y family protein n=1 Tax=Nitratireductor arenosus TaxID=2682096 RepID=UPI001FEAA2B4|nr:DNA polymerase Y family protein [Nitratireductor arenosus]